jgi:predicted ATPase/class 3 adenylate cyclase
VGQQEAALSGLPTGTVTFLFTDIQGSTRLWQDHPRDMKTALARHDALLRGAIESNHGSVFKTVGDAFCAAFATALDGVQAALAAQLALRAEGWPPATPILARMALHTGEAEEREGDFFGPALNRAARLLAIGHGAQTLLSLVTAELVRDALPEGVSLREMGEQRLKDLTRPESVYQLQHPALPADFPPLHSLDAHPHNLPVQPTPLIGREKELAEVEGLIAAGTRVLTLTGPGGMGKTRLALQAAANLIERFRYGVFFVDLSSLTDPALVPARIAQALRLQETGPRPLVELLREFLCQKRILLVMDNFEQVLEAAMQLVDLLASCPHVRFLVTSREALRVRGERVFLVPPLSLPEKRAHTAWSPATLGQYDAVRLFIERAIAVRPDFLVTNDNAPAVAEVCVRLEGIPLAIELAAARVRLLTPEMILEKLGRRLALLTGGSRDLPQRQRTLRATIDWSYDLLDPAGQAMLRMVSVFAGGFGLQAAEEVFPPQAAAAGNALDCLQSLFDKSLLGRDERQAGAFRFRLLEMVREYAAERLESCGEAEEVRSRHADYFRRLARQAEQELSGPRVGRWLDLLEEERGNLRDAFRWLLDRGSVEEAAELCCDLGYFWELRRLYNEGSRWMEELSSGAGQLPDRPRARARLWAGNLALNRDDYEGALPLLAESLAMFESQADHGGAGLCRHALGRTSYRLGRLEEAREHYRLGLSKASQSGWPALEARIKLGLGLVAWKAGALAEARGLFEQCLQSFLRSADRSREAEALVNLGIIEYQLGELDAAGRRFRAAIGIQEEIGDLDGRRHACNNLAFLLFKQSHHQEALECFRKLVAIAEQEEDLRGLAAALSGMADIHRALKEDAEAVRLAERAIQVLAGSGDCAELGVACRALGEALFGLGELEQAEAQLRRGIPILERFREEEDLQTARHAHDSVLAELKERNNPEEVKDE